MWFPMRKRTVKGLRSRLLLFGLCALIAGCAKETGDISGKVTYRGKHLEFGSVNVIDVHDQPHAAEIQSDGTYSIQKVPLGPARVCVTAVDPKVQEEIKRILTASKTPGPDGKMPPKPYIDPKKLHLIPEKYNSPENSGLTLEVQKGSTTYDIPLVD